MKTIKISDELYNSLIELSYKYRTQNNLIKYLTNYNQQSEEILKIIQDGDKQLVGNIINLTTIIYINYLKAFYNRLIKDGCPPSDIKIIFTAMTDGQQLIDIDKVTQKNLFNDEVLTEARSKLLLKIKVTNKD